MVNCTPCICLPKHPQTPLLRLHTCKFPLLRTQCRCWVMVFGESKAVLCVACELLLSRVHFACANYQRSYSSTCSCWCWRAAYFNYCCESCGQRCGPHFAVRERVSERVQLLQRSINAQASGGNDSINTVFLDKDSEPWLTREHTPGQRFAGGQLSQPAPSSPPRQQCSTCFPYIPYVASVPKACFFPTKLIISYTNAQLVV